MNRAAACIEEFLTTREGEFVRDLYVDPWFVEYYVKSANLAIVLPVRSDHVISSVPELKVKITEHTEELYTSNYIY